MAATAMPRRRQEFPLDLGTGYAATEQSGGESSKIEQLAGGNATILERNGVGAENAIQTVAITRIRQMKPSVLDGYDPQGFYCEMLQGAASQTVRDRLSGLSIEALKQRAASANASFIISALHLRSIRTPRRSTESCRSM
jgi:hypothetical protein